MKKIKVMTVFGTRPEAIKMAPLVKALEATEWCETQVAVTGQHREMLDQVLEVFAIKPAYDLAIMKAGQTIEEITTRILSKFGAVLEEAQPDLVLVHGDTTTAFAAGLSAFYRQIPVGHVEAGLRTWDLAQPFPEEANRQLIDVFAQLYFAPTQQSRDNLLKEGKKAAGIFVTGNTAIDAMGYTVAARPQLTAAAWAPGRKVAGAPKILVTMHRRENLGEPMAQVFRALRRVLAEQPEARVVFPMHKNPAVRKLAQEILGDLDQVELIEPLDVVAFQNLMAECQLVLTDSGGLQEEAPGLGVPVLVLRETTERPEGVQAGTVRLMGTEKTAVYQAVTAMLTDEAAYHKMARAANPYGDGTASQRIVAAIAYHFGLLTTRPADFTF